MITVKRNFKSVVDVAALNSSLMREIGLYARERIVRRTRMGMGPNGAFAPLSPAYAARKQAALGTSKPDLTVSGNMLNDLTITEATENTVSLGWNK